jgi:16S rRNA (guanine966-N2)-methyltransferase
MRIIAGQYKGRKLTPPQNDAIRPTSDRTRESVFNLLMHGRYAGEAIIGQHVVDLCCGTGAMGLEALSRGARIATFIDQDKRALELARANVLHCGAGNAAFFVAADATRLPAAREAAALVFIDPPYDKPMLPQTFASLRAGGWLKPDTLIVYEQFFATPNVELEGAALIDERKYGKAKVLVYRVALA